MTVAITLRSQLPDGIEPASGNFFVKQFPLTIAEMDRNLILLNKGKLDVFGGNISGNLSIGGDLTLTGPFFSAVTANFTGSVTIGDDALNGGVEDTFTVNAASTFKDLVNFDTASTVKVLNAADATGANTGALQVLGGVWVAKDLFIDGGDLRSNASSFNLLNNSTTISAFTSATSITVGAGQGTLNLLTAALTGTQLRTLRIGSPSSGSDAATSFTAIVLGSASSQSTIGINGATTITGSFSTTSTTNATIGGTLTASSNFTVNGATTTINSTSITLGTSTGSFTVNNATLSLPNTTTIDINGVNPTLASTSTGTLSLFNSNIRSADILGGQTGTIKLGSTSISASPRFDLMTAANTSGIKTVNIATGGASGSTTTIAIGSTAGTSTVALNGAVTISGDLTVNGTTTTVNSTTVSVDDKNIELGSVATPTDTTADGGGITLKGATDKTIVWDSTNTNWTLSEHVNIPAGKSFKINNANVLTATTLGTGVTVSSLTSVGTLTTGVWNATTIAVANGGTGTTTSTGSGSVVLSTSPSLTTPSLGAASATSISATGNLSASTLISTVATGTAPFSVTSTTAVTNLSIGGNASTATTLQTARTINGVSFNGSANITVTANTPNSLSLAVSGTGLSGSATFNGSTATTFTVSSNATSANTASTIVARDDSGNFSAGTITAATQFSGPGTGLTGTANSLSVGSALVTNRVRAKDTRTISPSSDNLTELRFGFTSFSNNNTSPYADYLHLRSYTDATGGNDNLVMFRKDAIGMRIYQQTFDSTTAYSSFKDVAWTDGTNASGTWGINITGNAETVDGFSASQSTLGNHIVVRDANAYIFGTYINMSDDGNPGGGTGITSFITKQGDNFYRSVSVTNAANRIRDGATGTWSINVTGNAASSSASTTTSGLNSTALNTSYIWTATQNFLANSAVGFGSQSGNLGVYGNSAGVNAAVMNFHRPGAYAINMGLDTDNVFRLGGWSDGANVFRMQINTAGDATFRGNVTAYSDERFKKDWANLSSNFIDQLSKVKSGTYTRIDSNERQAGVSAQSLKEILPEAILETQDGLLSVAYGNAALVACIELAKRVTEQQAQIDELKALLANK